MQPSKIWTEADRRRLAALWNEKDAAGLPKHSSAQIGRMLGVSKNSIVSQTHRMGLPSRPSPCPTRRYPNGTKPAPARPLRPGETTLPPLPSLSIDESLDYLRQR